MIVEKPWGTYEILLDVPERGYKVKRIVVYPYQRFSLQYHKKRTEHWSIVSGTGTITINDKEYDVSVGSNWVILPKAIHRATAGGTDDLVFIETQIGNYGRLAHQKVHTPSTYSRAFRTVRSSDALERKGYKLKVIKHNESKSKGWIIEKL